MMTTASKTHHSLLPSNLRPLDMRRDLREVADLVEMCFAKTLDGILARDNLLNDFGTIDIPTLVISGEADAACDPVQSERMHTKLPNSQLVQIPDVGHTPPVEAPEIVNTTISDFLVSLPSPSRKEEVPS